LTSMALLLLVFLALVVNISSQGCTYTEPGGKQFDLSGLNKPTGWYTNATSQYTYELNVCGVVQSSGCSTANGLLCQYNTAGGSFVSMLAGWNVVTSGSGNPAKPYGEWGLIDTSNPDAGVFLNFSNGASCYMNAKNNDRVVLMKFFCQSGGGKPDTFNLVEFPTCTFTVTYYSDAGCPLSSSGSGGISGGSVFLIMVAIALPLYILIGCIYKSKAQGTAGMESCPNIEFWRDLPGLIKDGFKFIAGGCKKGSGDSYDEL